MSSTEDARRFVGVGECMIEMSADADGRWHRNFGGDTFNTTWYVRSCLDGGVGYVTVLGQDPISDEMVGFMRAAGLDTGAIARHPTRIPGLYMITVDDGERTFTYWRDLSAARTLADDAEWLDGALTGVELIYFSGITVAILGAEGRSRLFDVLSERRSAGARLAFDPNLRPRLWSDLAEMRAATVEAAALSQIVLPSFEDEATHFGDASLEATAERYAALGASEVVVKNGGQEMLVHAGGTERVEFGPPVKPVDTTAAGDSFNAGYLAERLEGADVLASAAAGDALARQVILHRGALVPVTPRTLRG